MNIEHLVVFTFYKDSPPISELITKLPYQGTITEVHVTSPSASYPVLLELQVRVGDSGVWSDLEGTNLGVGPSKHYDRKATNIDFGRGTYFRLKGSLPQIDYGLIYQFLINTTV